MATLPALVDALGTVAADRPAVEFVSRILRDAGLIQAPPPGRGAMPMSARDAAALLIGCTLPVPPRYAVELVPQVCALRRTAAGSQVTWQGVLPDGAILANTLGEALEQLILCARDIQALFSFQLHSRGRRLGNLQLGTFDTALCLSIAVSDRPAARLAIDFHAGPEDLRVLEIAYAAAGKARQPGRHVERIARFDWMPIAALHRALTKEATS